MKQFSLLLKSFWHKQGIVLLTFVLLLGFKNASANLVVGYTPSCVTAGQTVTIGVNSVTTYTGTWFHWQYRVTPAGAIPGAWVFLNGVPAGTPVNNTINGTVFPVSNANIVSPSNNYSFNLVIASTTTALNDVEFRVLVGPFGDPQAVPSPVWNGDDQSPQEAKTVRIRIRPATENCFSGCADNILVTNPPSNVNTPNNEYYGGFETGASNFGGTAGNGSSVTAQTDLNVWTSGIPANNSVGATNNAYTMIYQAKAFAPHTGSNMLAVLQAPNGSRVWYKTLVAPSAPVQQYYGGQLSFKVWASKTGPNPEAPCFALEVKGTNISNVTTTLSTLPVTMTTTAGQPGFAAGDWVQYSVSYFVPLGIYKSLEVSVKGNCTTPTNFALDDICLVAPTAAILPVSLSGFTGAYLDGASHLLWTTEYEKNTSHFEVLYSKDGVNFSTAGTVAATGNSSRQLNYTFTDTKATAGANYYKLKMVDKDGRYVMSNVLLLKGTVTSLSVTRVYPTPFIDNLNISIASQAKGQASVRILDNTGRVLASQNNAVSRGVTLVTVNNLGKLSRGIYILEVKANDEVITQKLIK
jgi:Secretion system C-terminal sorting domain